jgi:hypothetical protein
LGLTWGLPTAYQGVLGLHQVEAGIFPEIVLWILPPQTKPSCAKNKIDGAMAAREVVEKHLRKESETVLWKARPSFSSEEN